MQVAVFGAGYVGLVTGAVLAELGHQVRLVEVDPEKIAAIAAGRPPIYEAGLDTLLPRVVRDGRLSITADGARAVAPADVTFIAVGTPPLANGDADLRFVRQAAEAIGAGMEPGRRRVVVNKATVPIGSANLVEVWISEAYRRRWGREPDPEWFAVASNPEFLREGTAVFDTLYPDRLVLGADQPWAVEMLRALYDPIIRQAFEPPPECPRPEGQGPVPVVESDRISAEMIKYAANAFLATKISFANEMAAICERVGADVVQVMAGIGLDQRIGPRFLNAGAGWGGSCFGKDLAALIFTAREYGYEPRILEATVAVNRDQRRLIVARVQEALKTVKGRRIAVWGLSFKPGTDDLRDAPALTVIRELVRLGARIAAYDPIAMTNAARQHPELEIRYAPDALSALEGAEALVIMTEWDEFRRVPLAEVRQRLAQPYVIDGRNLLDPAAAKAAGLWYRGIGR
ncbi:MAG: UDP-glucose/GDP-mannose dehydrogenase family protein [Firmicutes bacterium]|nr:UDP-glucose/GDP-mannose dehydrogenase family protein [Alicyclobacillaceae bacterium]MCL6497130.1 UDP-glucose/GDP-mannose dehydrogenase family protein [Bacillota bacterium]